MEKLTGIRRKKNKRWQVLRDYVMIIIGTGLIALAIQFVYDPSRMVTGGFSGIAIIIKSITKGLITGGIPLWVTNLVLNMPVFVMAWLIKGKQFVGRTAIATVLLSAWLYLIPSFDVVKGDLILAAIFGGLLSGAGIGFVLRAKSTTGGTDMVSVLLQHKLFRHYSVVQIMQILDGLIVLAGTAIFGLRLGMYAIVTIFIIMKVSDALTEGVRYSRVAYIITDHKDQVSAAIMKDLNRGVTGLQAKGMYSNQEKCMLYCVVSKKEVVSLKDLVKEIDEKAFIIVTDAREVLGEGFIED